MAAYGVTAKDFGHFAITAHDNGFTNPMGYLRKKIDMETYLNSKMLVDPLKIFDAPPHCDGAAAIILATEEVARAAHRSGLPMVKVAGSAIGTDSLALDARRAILELDGVTISTRRALEQAGVKNEDIDIFELHDAFTIITALSLEAAGFAKKGRGFISARTVRSASRANSPSQPLAASSPAATQWAPPVSISWSKPICS